MKITSTYKGLITGIIMIAVSIFLFYNLKLEVTGRNQFIPLVIYLGGIIWSLIAFKNSSTEEKTFKQYFSEGFKVFVVVALLMAIYTFVFYKMNPQILENSITQSNAIVIKEGNHTPDEITANNEKLRSIFMPMMLMVNTAKFLFLGALVTLVGAGLLSQKRNA